VHFYDESKSPLDDEEKNDSKLDLAKDNDKID